MNKNRSISKREILFMICISLFSVLLITNVLAQEILSENTNEILDINYQLDISELNLTNSNQISFDNTNNITIINRITTSVDYLCQLSIDNIARYTINTTYSNNSNNNSNYTNEYLINQSMIGIIGNHIYEYSGSTNNITSTISVTQTLDEIFVEGLYVGTLNCIYDINTTNNTLHIVGDLSNIINDTNIDEIYSYDNIFNETILLLNQASLNTNKFLFIDTLFPQISLVKSDTEYSYYDYSNATIDNLLIITNITNKYNNSIIEDEILLNFSIIDASLNNCSIIISNPSYNELNTNYSYSFNYYPNYSDSNYPYGYLYSAPKFNSNIVIPINVSSLFTNLINQTTTDNLLKVDYIITCQDIMNTFGVLNSSIYIMNNITINYSNNSSNNTSNETINNSQIEIPFFNITVSKEAFSIGEIGHYKIDANNNSNVSITICPISNGWVQCFLAPTFVNDTYPKIQSLPYTNKTGQYLISGIMNYQNYTIIRNTTYETANTISIDIDVSDSSALTGDIITFNATASNGIAPYTYKWTMHDGTKFTGTGAYKNYTVAGKFQINLTVNDSVGNNYTGYVNVTVKNSYILTIIVTDNKTNKRISESNLEIGSLDKITDSTGVAVFRLSGGDHDITVSKENYDGYTYNLDLDTNKTLYLNMSYLDYTSPKITLLTDDEAVMSSDSVDLKFKASDNSNMLCSLYIANVNSSWYTLKDSGSNLLTDTIYTFELRDLNNGAHKWKIECNDNENNVAYSEERTFVVSDGDITIALSSFNQNSDNINVALDNMDKLSGDESVVADILNIRYNLNQILERINRLDKDVHDLAYRRDLTPEGITEAQGNLTTIIENMKYNTPINLKITDSKTFVKYVRDDELKSLIEEYSVIKNLKFDKKLFLESTKNTQSKVIISTRARNVDLYYLDGKVSSITLISKEIQFAKVEDEYEIKNSNTITFVEVIPKTITQSVKQINILNDDYEILKDDPIIEYPSDTTSINYYINETIALDEFENTDTIIIEKNIKAIQSTTGFSILGIDTISNIKLEGQGIMIIILVVLLLFYIVVNFDIIEKIRNLSSGVTGFGSKKKVTYIRVLINDAIDYLKTGDYDKAALIYREIKLSYESTNDYVRKQVYDESFELCNQLDLNYALSILDRAESYISINDRNNSLLEFEKLENTYNKLDDKYRTQIENRFQRIVAIIKNKL
ncbi:MAG: PKD domain-containing protein [Candidatus Woesearchaeota archaeon]